MGSAASSPIQGSPTLKTSAALLQEGLDVSTPASGRLWRSQGGGSPLEQLPAEEDCVQTLGALSLTNGKAPGSTALCWSIDTSTLLPLVRQRDGCGVACFSQPFTLPDAAKPSAVERLLTAQYWCLYWKVEDWNSLTLSLHLKWLGGMSGWAAADLSLCCEFSLEAECSVAGQGGRQLQGRTWLSHAFTGAERACGLKCATSLDAARALAPNSQLKATLRVEAVTAHLGGAVPGVVLHEVPLVLRVSTEPSVLMVDNFLSPAECEAVQALAGPHLVRSKVASGSLTRQRTSSSCFLLRGLAVHPLAVAVDVRIQALADLAARICGRGGLSLGEAMQVIKYREGEFYTEHYDGKEGRYAERAATVMVYLNDVEKGGVTEFPRSTGYPLADALADCRAGAGNSPAAPEAGARGEVQPPEGLRVVPKQGRAVLFWNRRPDGEPDTNSMHAARTVLAGEKWLLTRWCSEES